MVWMAGVLDMGCYDKGLEAAAQRALIYTRPRKLPTCASCRLNSTPIR